MMVATGLELMRGDRNTRRIRPMTIARKGLLIVAIPLLAQIVFLITLVAIRNERLRRESLEAESRTVLARISALETALAESAAAVRAYVASAGAPFVAGQFVESARGARLHSSALISLGVADPEIASLMQAASLESGVVLDGYSRIKALQDSGQTAEARELMLTMLEEKKLIRVQGLLSEIKTRESALAAQRSRDVRDAHARSERLVVVGFGASAALALGLGVFFYTSVSRRLRQLANNAFAIQDGSPAKPIGGDDELTEVDRAVRTAGTTVARTTRRLRDNAERLSQLNTAQAELMDIGLDLPRMLGTIAASAKQLTGADGAVVDVAEGTEMVCRAAAGSAEGNLGIRVPAEGSISGLCFLSSQTVICDDSEEDPRANVEACRKAGARSLVAVPLNQKTRPWGVLEIISSQATAFAPSVIDTLELLSRSFSGALANASLYRIQAMEAEERSAELASLRNRFEAFMDHMPVLAFIKDADGLYLYANPAMRSEVARRGVSEPLAATAGEWLPPELALMLERQDREILASEQPLESTQTLHLDGSASHFLMLRFPILEPDGRKSLGGIAIDVTERIEAENEVRRLNEELEERVAERTGQLEVANSELEAFAYSVSHDLRTPLRAINGYVRMFEEDFGATLDPEGLRLMEVIRQNAGRMGQLIDELLRFSRLSRQALNVSRVDTAALVRQVFDDLTRDNGPARPRLTLGELPAVEADASLLRQVFENLISNAVKFSSRKDQPRIEIGASASNGDLVFHVRDNGAGFDMQYADKLFGVFQRLHRHDEFEGTGVGLAIVQRIISRHGGRIWAEGTLGEGAAFYFSLPEEIS